MFGVLWTRSLAVGCANIDREDAIRVFTDHAPAAEPVTRNTQLGPRSTTMEVRGLQEVMSWVMGFGRHAEVLEPAHLREAVAQELAATTGKYAEETAPIMYQDDSQRRTA